MGNFNFKKLHGKRKPGNFYKRITLIIILFACLPTAIISTSLFILGRSYIANEVKRNHQEQMKITTQRIRDYVFNLEVTANQWAMSPIFSENLKSLNLISDYKNIHDIYDALFIIKATNPLIDQVYLYLNNPQSLFSTDKGKIIFIKDNEINMLSSMLENEEFIFWADASKENFSSGVLSSLSLVRKLSVGVDENFGLLQFRIDEKKLNSMLKELTNNDDGVSFFLKENKDWIYSNNNNIEKLSQFEIALREELLNNHKQEVEAFNFKWKDKRYLVSYDRVKLINVDWIYVTATPLNDLTAPIDTISIVTLLISAAGIIFAFLMSIFASKKLYEPIKGLLRSFSREAGSMPEIQETEDEIKYIERYLNNVMEESNTVKKHLQEELPALRESFLLKLLNGYYNYSSNEEILEKMKQLGWEMKGKAFGVLLFRITGVMSPKSPFSLQEEQELTFAASNIIEEMTKDLAGRLHVVNFQDLSVAVVISYDRNRERVVVREELYRESLRVMEILQSILKINITVCLGKLTTNVYKLSSRFKDACRAFTYRKIQEGNQFIDVVELMRNEENSSCYPLEIEKEIIQVMKLGLKDETLRLTRSFIRECESNSDRQYMLQQNLLQLLGTMQHTIIECGFSFSQVYGDSNLYVELSQISNFKHILKWFEEKVLLPYFDKYNESQSLYLSNVVDKAIEIIHKDYMKDLSLEFCAELAGVKPYTLSKAFKQVKGINYIDYLTGFRLEKAKKLLVETDLKVNDVADAVGYQINYFFKIFKKYEDMTPGQYREKMQKKREITADSAEYQQHSMNV